ncbi:hypothetical protein [Halorhabdus rudnickae]|uniref:hypothetical protein n=1 Tax=Halorhabdus rudnickae TaxID=1775544 RepID=UPI0010827A49|nr:hypothetical protein [Halorhabdus rudnickae]
MTTADDEKKSTSQSSVRVSARADSFRESNRLGGPDGSTPEPGEKGYEWLSDQILNLGLIAMGLLAMTYGNLVLYNTGEKSIDGTGLEATFTYVSPPLAMAGTIALYVLAFLFLCSVGSEWADRMGKLAYLVPIAYVGTGYLFLKKVFASPTVRSRVIGGMTDAYVLQYEGAKSLLSGVNPYHANYTAEILANVPAYYRTPVGAGDRTNPETIVTTLDYPPMATIWYTPARVLGISGALQDVIVVALVALLLMAVARKELRVFVPVFFLLDWNLIIFPASYVPDMGWVVFVILALVTFHRPRLSAVAFALAASYRPQPIVIAPFFAIMAYRTHGLDYLKTWIPTGLAATAVINLPFVLWTGPAEYVHAVTIPIRASLPSSGVGPAMFVDPLLEMTALSPGTVKTAFTIVVVLAFVVTLDVAWTYYDRLGVGILAFPAVVLWFHWRSLQNYMIWFPLLVLSARLFGLPETDPLATLSRRVRPLISAIENRIDSVRSHRSERR